MISRGYETIEQEYAKVTHVIAVFKPTSQQAKNIGPIWAPDG